MALGLPSLATVGAWHANAFRNFEGRVLHVVCDNEELAEKAIARIE